MNIGDLIWYRRAQLGGYCFAIDVPGKLIRKDGKRWRISVTKKDGTETVISVAPRNVRPRNPEEVWR